MATVTERGIVAPDIRVESGGFTRSVRLQTLLPIWLPWAIRRWPMADEVATRLWTMSQRRR